MAFSIPWLETVSKKERQRREEKAQKLMFPFGDEQRTAELAVLRALIQTKARDADLLYQLFQAKDCLRPMQDEMPEEQQERLASWLTSQLARSFKPALIGDVFQIVVERKRIIDRALLRGTPGEDQARHQQEPQASVYLDGTYVHWARLEDFPELVNTHFSIAISKR